jgi:NAD(P)H-quinone oxidoreductase subunit 5
MNLHPAMDVLGYVVVATPMLLVVAIGLPSLLSRPLSERTTSRLVQLAMVCGFLASSGMLIAMLVSGARHVPIHLGTWAEVGGHAHAPTDHEHFHFAFKFVFDRLSVPFALLTYLLCGVIGKFATRYLHRESGYNRFFVSFSLFALGMILTTLAGTIETLFSGWEVVGISSALLVAFYHEREAPVTNGLRVWSVYRISDAALLIAAIVLHHLRGAGDFDALLAAGPWPGGTAAISSSQALLVGSLLLTAAAGKSALIPFCGWLPRAMEGPTPSSAIFYGALSVHLGAFLLLRISPLLEASLVLQAMVVVMGVATALLAATASRVQPDIKSALSFASLTQVGLIVAEIGIGLRYIPLIHILGHACLRTLQFLRAPSLLHDYRTMENALGNRLDANAPSEVVTRLPFATQSWMYRFALRRGYLDVLLDQYVAHPLLQMLRACDRLERRWTDFLSGRTSQTSDNRRPSAESVENVA